MGCLYIARWDDTWGSTTTLGSDGELWKLRRFYSSVDILNIIDESN